MSPSAVVPEPLREGDQVAVVAPAGPVKPDRLVAGVAHLERWGLTVQVMDHVLDSGPLSYLAGDDSQRSKDLQQAWLNDSYRAIFCARGGFGSSRLLDHLDWTQMRGADPKWLIGSSDVTALHEAFAVHLGVASAMGPMVASELFAEAGMDDTSLVALHDFLFRGTQSLRVELAGPTISPGVATGPLVGGNLAVLASTIGTRESVSASDAVVLLEEVAEQPYRVDRLLTQLRRSGWLDRVRGIALGDFVDCGEVWPVLEERLGDLGIPVVAGLEVGHGSIQRTVPIGLEVELRADARELRVLHRR